MKGRFWFYLIISVITGLSVFLSYRLFFYEAPEEGITSSESSDSKSKSPSSPTHEKQGSQNSRAGSLSESSGVWNDKRILNLKTDEIRLSAEVQNNIQNLTDLMTQKRDVEFLAKVDALIAANPKVPQYL